MSHPAPLLSTTLKGTSHEDFFRQRVPALYIPQPPRVEREGVDMGGLLVLWLSPIALFPVIFLCHLLIKPGEEKPIEPAIQTTEAD